MEPHHLITSASVFFIALTVQTRAAVSLGTAVNFRALAATTITNTGPTVVDGDIGVHDGTAITGFFGTVENDGPGTFTGTAHQGNATAEQAQIDANTAFTGINALNVNVTTLGVELAGQTLNPGTYKLGSAEMDGILTLSGGGDYFFQIDSTLITSAASSVFLIDGAQASDVFWAVGTSSTLGAGSVFAGNIIASASVGLGDGAFLNGRAIALNGAATLENNTIIPEPSTMSLLALLSMGLIVRRRRA